MNSCEIVPASCYETESYLGASAKFKGSSYEACVNSHESCTNFDKKVNCVAVDVHSSISLHVRFVAQALWHRCRFWVARNGVCRWARPKEAFHLLTYRSQRRLLQGFCYLVSKDLATPCTVKCLPDSTQIVLTTETRVTPPVDHELCTEERLVMERVVMTVWRIGSLHLSKTETRYLVGQMTNGVLWDRVYGMLKKVALPESWAFTACTGGDTATHGRTLCEQGLSGRLNNCVNFTRI